MTIIEVNNIKIACNLSGKGDTTLLFVHGAFIDMSYWESQVSFFEKHYQVITIDLPGHGKSGKSKAKWTIEELGNDLSALITKLNLRKVVLIGHSMGGDVILEATLKCKDSVIGFIGVDNFKNAGIEMPPEIQSQIDQVLENLKTDFPNTSENFARQALLSPETDQKIVDRVASDFRNMDKIIGIDLITSAFTYNEREKELMNQLKIKMHLINVDNSPTNKELLKIAGGGYKVLPINGTCHYPMIENPHEFNRLLQDIATDIKQGY